MGPIQLQNLLLKNQKPNTKTHKICRYGSYKTSKPKTKEPKTKY